MSPEGSQNPILATIKGITIRQKDLNSPHAEAIIKYSKLTPHSSAQIIARNYACSDEGLGSDRGLMEAILIHLNLAQ